MPFLLRQASRHSRLSVLLSLGALLLALVLGCTSQPAPRPDAPPQAVQAAQGLVSHDVTAVRASVTDLLATSLTPDDLAPAGTVLTVDKGTWKEDGNDASLQATVALPQQAPARVVVYLTRENGQWRVLSTDPIP
ncbi:hypothetical protein [Amycolatopsis sp. FDAARGOS 1241]|uniref:hypothetical protein n=1 Tax=Amycolatopsis sp. FDAARGOS 1241 TaxID=2778070 RepID=UPI0019504F0F|nr:hypothetical protein [Amycolatopsis sp. FDAARGOS 1241]QRP42785.1 hypothetical protein I6J71_25260 [Amycolatopsis sp. FDAARGOS 1241]